VTISTREQALAALGLSASPQADADTVQRAFERLARRYPSQHFPERFRELLEARDRLLESGRTWREELQSSTLNLSWILPYLRPEPAAAAKDTRAALQSLLRAGYRAEGLAPE
jgi:hypothetical protein